MKTFPLVLWLLPACFLFTARAEVPATTTPDSTPATAPATPAPAPSSSSSMIQYTDAPAPDDIDPAKKAEIVKLLQATGTVKMTQQIMGQMISQFKMQNSRVSQDFWDRFEKEMNIQGLVDKIIPLYAKYYSLDDLKALNAFYQTPAGQRMLAATPQIMHESMQIGQDWGRQVVTHLMTELREEKAKEKAAEAAAAASTNTAPSPVSSPAPSTNAAPVPASAPPAAPAPSSQ
jgi:hypothetical protein